MACPEGASTNAAYTGPSAGGNCRCYAGWVFLNGKCQSPQSISQQGGTSYSDYANLTQEQYLGQDLTAFARQYIQMTGHSISCKLVYPSAVPGQPNLPTRMCSIDGGPFEHGAYAINLNPETAIVEVEREKALQQYAQQTGKQPYQVVNDPAVTQMTNASTQSRIQDLVSGWNDLVDQVESMFSSEGQNQQQQQQEQNGDDSKEDSEGSLLDRTVELFGYDVPVVLLLGLPVGYFFLKDKS